MKHLGIKTNFISKFTMSKFFIIRDEFVDGNTNYSKLFEIGINQYLNTDLINQEISKNGKKTTYDEIISTFCHENLKIYPWEEIDKKIKSNTIKIGDEFDLISFGIKMDETGNDIPVILKDKLEIGRLDKKIRGENLLIVEDVLKRLNGNFFDGWEFKYEDNPNIEITEIKNGNYIKSYFNLEVGDNLYITKENVGKLSLCEMENSIDNRIKINKIERHKDGKKGLGRSILTILSRVTKGNDIIIELVVGDINNKDNEKINNIKFDSKKLIEIYKSRGFKRNVRNSVLTNQTVMDNEEVVEEYIKRMGWEE